MWWPVDEEFSSQTGGAPWLGWPVRHTDGSNRVCDGCRVGGRTAPRRSRK